MEDDPLGSEGVQCLNLTYHPKPLMARNRHLWQDQERQTLHPDGKWRFHGQGKLRSSPVGRLGPVYGSATSVIQRLVLSQTVQ